jgi:hypothetical protein
VPVASSTSKRFYRHISQEVCPWNGKFSQELAEASPFRAREFTAGKDARALATDFLAKNQELVKTGDCALKYLPVARNPLRCNDFGVGVDTVSALSLKPDAGLCFG